MLANMSSVRRPQMDCTINNANSRTMSIIGVVVAYSSILSKFSYGSPAFVSVTTA